MRQSLVAALSASSSAAAATLVALIAAGSSLAAADGGETAPVGELRLLAGMSPAYEVSETAESGGASTTYRWEGADSDAGTFAVQYVRPYGSPMTVLGQPIFGLEVLFSAATLRPDSYTVDGSSYANTTQEEFSYLAMTPTAIAGWRFAEPESRTAGLVGELHFLLGATVLRGEVLNQAGSDDTSIGYGFEVGARAMLGLKEGGWTGAVVAGVRRGWASIEMERDGYGSSATSTLDLDRVGAELMLVVGHSF